MRGTWLAAIAVSLVSLSAGQAQTGAAEDPWAAYRFLIGDWVGDGQGQPGKGGGEFSFAPDLKGKVLVRKNRAEFPAAGGRPAASHEDLLIVYQEQGVKAPRAIYLDSEGHVIHYTPSFSDEGRTITFLSDAVASQPRFRLTYTKQEGDTVRVCFDIAPPGRPEAFKTYLEGNVRRKDRR